MFGLGEKYVVGYDISNEYAQISYMTSKDEMPSTVSLTSGNEDYNIPMCLFKREDVSQWFYGREAQNLKSVEKGQLIDNLWERALVGDKLEIEDSEFDPVAVLALYIKRSFGALKGITLDKISGIMFTVPRLTKRAIEVLDIVTETLDFKDTSVYYEGRDESIFYYIINQPRELWKGDVYVYDFADRNLVGYRFFVNRNATPGVAFVDSQVHSIARDDNNKDEKFAEVVKKDTEKGIVSLAYLIGDGFEEEWCNESLRELCRNRRVFKGNNLYSKGACYAAKERKDNTDMRSALVFLGKDKLKANIGMNVTKAGKEQYYAILDGGENWYDAKKEMDVIPLDGNKFEIIVTPLDGVNARSIDIMLDGLNEREPGTTRLHLKFFMESEDKLRICATDMGFGEMYPTTYQLFTKQIAL